MWRLAQEVVREAGLERDVDPAKLEAAVEAASGVPTDVGFTDWPTPAVHRDTPNVASASAAPRTSTADPSFLD
jgi:hypothetical protein